MDDAPFVAPAWLSILGLLLAAPAAPPSESAAPAKGASAETQGSAERAAGGQAAAKTAKPAAKPSEIPLPPPPALRARPAAAKPVEKPAPDVYEPAAPTAVSASAAPAAEDLARDQLLLEQKCSKCHDVSQAFSAELSDAQWRGHMKRMNGRPGAAITDEQAKRIQRALRARRAGFWAPP